MQLYAVTSPPIALACSWQLFCAFMWMEIFFKMKGETVFKKSPRTCGHRLRWPSSDHSLCEHCSVTADLKLVHREKQATFISSWFLCWRIFTGDTKLHEIRIMLLILAAFMGLGTTNSHSEWIKLSTCTTVNHSNVVSHMTENIQFIFCQHSFFGHTKVIFDHQVLYLPLKVKLKRSMRTPVWHT